MENQMNLDQHKEKFADAIRFASETLGISPIHVEKDYWITKMLCRFIPISSCSACSVERGNVTFKRKLAKCRHLHFALIDRI